MNQRLHLVAGGHFLLERNAVDGEVDAKRLVAGFLDPVADPDRNAIAAGHCLDREGSWRWPVRGDVLLSVVYAFPRVDLELRLQADVEALEKVLHPGDVPEGDSVELGRVRR